MNRAFKHLKPPVQRTNAHFTRLKTVFTRMEALSQRVNVSEQRVNGADRHRKVLELKHPEALITEATDHKLGVLHSLY